MLSNDPIAGRLQQYRKPIWAPLRDLVGHELAHWFMWMCEVELADGARVQAYKHVSTRRYLHLDAGGHAFTYTAEGSYRPIHRRDAIDSAFRNGDVLSPRPDDVAAARAALRRARQDA
jgi:hypothetical protein